MSGNGQKTERAKPWLSKVDPEQRLSLRDEHKQTMRQLLTEIRGKMQPDLDEDGRIHHLSALFVVGYMYALTGKLIAAPTAAKIMRRHEDELLGIERGEKTAATALDIVLQKMDAMQRESEELKKQVTQLQYQQHPQAGTLPLKYDEG